MGKTQVAKVKAPARPRRGRGRPTVAEPKVTFSISMDVELASELDAWAKANGSLPRSAAIRQILTNHLHGAQNKAL